MKLHNILRPITYILIFTTLFIEVGNFLRFILVDDTNSYTRITYHEMYEQDNIDVLFIGSSHCYCGFNPSILDSKLNCNTFNAGSSAQQIDGTYTLIKEIAKHNQVSNIYLELYYAGIYANPQNRTNLTQTYIIGDYLHPSFNKYMYLAGASNPSHYFNSFIPARRSWNNLYDSDYIFDLFIQKTSSAYRQYQYDYVTYDSDGYAGKGYIYSHNSLSDTDLFMDLSGETFTMDTNFDYWQNRLNQIVSYCNKKNIELTFVVAPMSDYYLSISPKYDEYVDHLSGLAEKYQIKYYDFNLCKEQYFPSDISLFKDSNHLNSYGAEILSNNIALLHNNEVTPSEMFYNSHAERINHLQPTILGLTYTDDTNDNNQTTRHCIIQSTHPEIMEYEISLVDSMGDTTILRDYSPLQDFTLPQGNYTQIIIKTQYTQNSLHHADCHIYQISE